MHAMVRAPLVGLLLGVAACGSGGGAEPAASGPRASSAGGDAVDPVAPAEDLRVLGAGATFGDLVTAARTLDERGEADAEAGCILRGAVGAPWRLEGDLAVAVRPLPDAPADLDERIERSDTSVRVLTRWGQLGTPGEDVALVAFTSTPPLRAETAVALFVTDRGVALRRAGSAAVEPLGPLPVEQAAARVRGAVAGGEPVFVTAEAGVSLERLRTVLGWLPDRVQGATALSVPLAPETRIPEPAEPAPDPTGLCPEGLPAPAGTEPEGRIGVPELVGALTPLREGARQCFDRVTGSAARGGLLSVQVRIGRDGEVTEVCFREDEVGDPGLRACVAEAARATRFPAPDPPGIVQAEVPLRFEADASLRQRPLCP